MQLNKYLVIIFLAITILNGINSAEAANTITVSGSTTADIQNALNQASSGDTILIPAGMYKYTGEITVNTPNLLIQGVGVNYNNSASGTYLYTDLYGYNSKIMLINSDNVRVTGIAFRGAELPAYGTRPGGTVAYWVSNGIWINDANNVRIDHNYFTSFGAAAIETSTGNNNNLLVDHNWLVDNYLEGYGYGVNVGKSKIFIEDNYFEDNRHDVAANSNGHYVARYNYVYNSEDTCTVGTGSPFPRNFDAHRGTGKVEIYNNYIKHDLDSGQGVLMRGVYNGAMIYDNTFETMPKGIRFVYYDYEGGDVAGDKYWVWDNNYIDVTNEVSIESSGFDIFYNLPSDYTPDPYPHPLNDDPSKPGINGIFKAKETEPVNEMPVFDPIEEKSLNEGSLLEFTISATDPDGDALVYSANNLPLGANFNPATHTFSWIPGVGQAGSYQVHFEVTDGLLNDVKDIMISVNAADVPIIQTAQIVIDNRLREATPDNVISDTTWIDVGMIDTIGNYRDLIWFDLSDFNSTDNIEKATLSLFWYYESESRNQNTEVSLYRPANWDANYVTWNTRTNGVVWNNPGGDWYDRNNVAQGAEPYAINTFLVATPQDNAYHDFDVTELVQKYVDGTYDNTGFIIKTNEIGNDYIGFYSSDWSNANQRPKLTIIKKTEPVNEMPVFDPIEEKSLNEGSLLEFTISATDPDGDALVYSANNLPLGANFDPATHTFSWVPGVGQAGSYQVHFEVTDGSLKDVKDVLISVNVPIVKTAQIVIDNRLREASPDTILSDTTWIDVGMIDTIGNYRDLIWFDLSDLNQTDNIEKATLSLFWYYESKNRNRDTEVGIYRPANWDTNYVTWNTPTSGIAWNNLGGDWYDMNNIAQGAQPFTTITFPAGTSPDYAYHDFDVTELVQSYVDGTYENTGFFIKANEVGDSYIAFYSSEWSIDNQRPKLTIVLTAQ